MKRRSFLKKAAGGLAVGGTLAAPAIVHAQPKIQWRMTTSWTKSLDTLFGGADLVARRVGEITD
ncbi:MAG TPA: twin-arginine translocation signal domain-containing protein, partial [Myxococcota bacterium]|nr:twin-arginine translocation signal domain-containing protein [Myxococcota bacterium]